MIGDGHRLRHPSCLPHENVCCCLPCFGYGEKRATQSHHEQESTTTSRKSTLNTRHNNVALHAAKKTCDSFFTPAQRLRKEQKGTTGKTRGNKICCGACAVAVEAVVEGAKVLWLHSALPDTFMLSGVSMQGVSPHTASVVVCVVAQGRCCQPGD